jgi:hypothetical protein
MIKTFQDPHRHQFHVREENDQAPFSEIRIAIYFGRSDIGAYRYSS